MAHIIFTQCDQRMEMDEDSKRACLMPIIPRLKEYVRLLEQHPTRVFTTFDEHFILVAQHMKREGKLKTLWLVSACEEEPQYRCFGTDTEGDMLGDPHHGFFTQRLELLR